jgi:choline-sulfatase
VSGGSQPKGVQHIILLSIDDLRFDAISCEHDDRYLRRYGLASMRHTQVLDRIAAEGVRVRQAISAAPYTTASHATMLTGCYPPRHGVRAFLASPLPTSVKTIAERLRELGYRTVGAIDFRELFDLIELSRGFDHVIQANDAALFEFLGTTRQERVFLFGHFVDVHPPYSESLSPPCEGYNDEAYREKARLAELLGLPNSLPPNATRADLIALSNRIRLHCEDRAIADTVQFPRYLKGVNKFDDGRLRFFLEGLRARGWLENTLLIITSDHGQAPLPSWKRANRHIPQKFDHGESVAEELIRVPLIFWARGLLPAGRMIDTQVSLADLAPTIMEYAGATRQPDASDGASLRGLLEGTLGPSSSGAYSEAWYHDRAELSAFLKRSTAAGRIVEQGYETFLFQASLRMPPHKYVETGGALNEDEKMLDEAAFARWAIRKVLGHIEDPVEVDRAVAALHDGVSRERLVAEFKDSHFHREALYDLESDPFEEVNLLGLEVAWRLFHGETRFTPIADSLRSRLREVQVRTEAADPQRFRDDEAMDRVSERLRLLGYID